jgi:methylmalonyl-CoA mutase
MTAELASRAWPLFQEVEKIGGMEAALRAGFPQAAVHAVAVEKIHAADCRRDSIVGVNQYASPKEQPLEVTAVEASLFHKRRAHQVASNRTSMDDADSEIVLKRLSNIINIRGEGLFAECLEAAGAGATLGEIVRAIRIHDHPCAPIAPVRITRVAVSFERLRAAMERHVASHHPRPQVFLCNMGPLREHKARADFSRGFFATGGYEVVSPEGFGTPEAAVQAFVQSGAQIVVICSTDENYPVFVPLLVKGIRAARPDAVIVLAGFPKDQIDAHKKTGVDEFIHIRADAVQLLGNFHARLGVEI